MKEERGMKEGRERNEIKKREEWKKEERGMKEGRERNERRKREEWKKEERGMKEGRERNERRKIRGRISGGRKRWIERNRKIWNETGEMQIKWM